MYVVFNNFVFVLLKLNKEMFQLIPNMIGSQSDQKKEQQPLAKCQVGTLICVCVSEADAFSYLLQRKHYVDPCFLLPSLTAHYKSYRVISCGRVPSVVLMTYCMGPGVTSDHVEVFIWQIHGNAPHIDMQFRLNISQ